MTNPSDETTSKEQNSASNTVPASTPAIDVETLKTQHAQELERVRREGQAAKDREIAHARKEEQQRAKERESALRGTYKQRLVQQGDQHADQFDASVDMAADYAELKQEKQATQAQQDARTASIQHGQTLIQQASKFSDIALDPNDPEIWSQPFSSWDEFEARIKSKVRKQQDAARQLAAQNLTDQQRKEATDVVNSGGLDTLTAPAAGAVSKTFDASKYNPITDAGKLHELAAQSAASKVKPRR